MTTIVACDPGIHGLGLAIFVDGELLDARYSGGRGGAIDVLLEPVDDFDEALESWYEALGGKIDLLLIEQPQIYLGAQAGNPEAIAKLLITVGAIICAARPYVRSALRVKPAEWKGQVPKDVMAGRIRARLTEPEAECFALTTSSARAGVLHNVIDAIGLGLHHLGRIK